MKNFSEKINNKERNKNLRKGTEDIISKEVPDDENEKNIDEVTSLIPDQRNQINLDLKKELEVIFENYEKENVDNKNISYTIKKNRTLLEVKTKIV